MIVESRGSRKPRSILETSLEWMPERPLTWVWLNCRRLRVIVTLWAKVEMSFWAVTGGRIL